MDGDVTLIENTKLVSILRELLSTKEENVEKALLYRTVATGRDVIEKQHTIQEASYGRDALAKVNVGGKKKNNTKLHVAVVRQAAQQRQKQHGPADVRGVVTFH